MALFSIKAFVTLLVIWLPASEANNPLPPLPDFDPTEGYEIISVGKYKHSVPSKFECTIDQLSVFVQELTAVYVDIYVLHYTNIYLY